MTKPLKNKGFSWFKFDVVDWLTSKTVLSMTLAERGLYITMLAVQWRDDGLPKSLALLSKVTGVDQRILRKFLEKYSELFVDSLEKSSEITNQKLLNLAVESGKITGRATADIEEKDITDCLDSEKNKKKKNDDDDDGRPPKTAAPAAVEFRPNLVQFLRKRYMLTDYPAGITDRLMNAHPDIRWHDYNLEQLGTVLDRPKWKKSITDVGALAWRWESVKDGSLYAQVRELMLTDDPTPAPTITTKDVVCRCGATGPDDCTCFDDCPQCGGNPDDCECNL
jgi:hypothetical protein